MDEGTARSELYAQRDSDGPAASSLLRSGRRAGMSPLFRAKEKHPSETMSLPDGANYECPWIEDSITVHSDGNVSCGLDDPHAMRSFGNVHEQSVAEIFANPEFDLVRQNLRSGRRCNGCNLYRQRSDPDVVVSQSRPKLPSTIVIETTVKCNLRCENVACVPNNAAGLVTRHNSHLDFSKFTEIVDELRTTLRTVYFFNYGEPFLHPKAEDMLLYLRQACPSAKIVSSTNGIPLSKRDRAEKLVESGIDSLTFTIGGLRQESYSRYHAGGQVGLALQGLQNVCEAKRRQSRRKPFVIWRYLAFRWNDSEDEIETAIALSKLYGVDQFCLYLTHMPPNGSSYRLSPGSPLYDKYRDYIDFVHGYDCVFPDARGFYDLENIDGLGNARWTSWRATAQLHREENCLRLSLSTNRPTRSGRSHYCHLRTTWMAMRVPLKAMEWRDVSILIPWAHRDSDLFDVEIVAPEAWFPVDEIGTRDLRCLGVLLRDESGARLREADEIGFARYQGLEPLSEAELAAVQAAKAPMRRQLQNNSGRFEFPSC